ncbi:hypothetical protein E2F43_13570 [Seongchinamella unica]|uniref:Uncharacterized protein n=1 Tax=Seongchinamella unica TaxID=2547392 RepID=A0A4R5LPX4_9GAMM|nr:hypothetical protein [Seongchinamella unica]TDG12614.1 hypothetical protein E2F43_13570 [Seongchinamella unica]
MQSATEVTANTGEAVENQGKDTPGRGYVMVIYGLYIGSIMAVVTAPLGAIIAHVRRGRSAPWLDTHLVFQIRTFWLGVTFAALSLLLWQLPGQLQLSPVYAWAFGYLFFTAGLAWMMARCAVGIHRLTSNRPVDAPKSWLFGL